MASHLAPTVATVWKVVRNAGDTVAKGDEIVILESMKMEIPVLAEQDGTIIKLHIEEGQPVEEDDPIADID